jgi:hypothetical protein
MYTLFDFITHVKGVEYILALMFIAGYLLFAEILKPKPFKSVVDTGKEDLSYLREKGFRNTLRTIGRIAAGPFIGLAYVVVLPFAFVSALGMTALNGILSLVGKSVSFGWRPSEAYLAGKKRKKEGKKQSGEK